MEIKLLNSMDRASLWSINSNIAQVDTQNFSGCVDLSNPAIGLHHLRAGNDSVEGNLLGIKTKSDGSTSALIESYSRGSDLVAQYAQSGPQSFSYEIYWRVIPCENEITILEAIVSLQTDLLESFPEFHIKSQLNSKQNLVARNLDSHAGFEEISQSNLESDDAGLLLMRPEGTDWSYAEMVHPDDPNRWQIEGHDQGAHTISRQLGGRFMEKGVIRRMRIRGAILPRDNDQQLATQCLEHLSAAAPPLTT